MHHLTPTTIASTRSIEANATTWPMIALAVIDFSGEGGSRCTQSHNESEPSSVPPSITKVVNPERSRHWSGGGGRPLTYWRVKYGMAKTAVDALTKATNMAERTSK